ncbi:hypothetical protein [Nocardia sp. NPDC050175]|uniref:hypothetical protein n=1 Tax=Nocardia sp. NPDC050175 TaxID=3364317 RepID=UPI0037AD2A9A
MASEPVMTLYDYQLAMLHVMCATAPAQATELLNRIGATHADAAAADKRWRSEEVVNNFGSLAGYVTTWGAPASEDTHTDGVRVARYARWDLSFWPGLQIELMVAPRGPHRVFRRLLRKPGIPQPPLDSVADLTPWSCTQDEFEACGLGPFEQFDGFGDIGVILVFEAVDAESGRKRRYRARFERGLLQSIEPLLVRLGKRNHVVATDADELSIDDLILTGRTYLAVKRIKAEIEGNGSAAISEYQQRYARLARERSNDFVPDLEPEQQGRDRPR